MGIKQYDEAEALSLQADQLEQIEREKLDDQLLELLEKKEEMLRTKQQKALSALLKRIQRDRNEQLKHR